MCSVVILRRPESTWPVIFAANRDEMNDRPWLAPGRHWPDRPETVAGFDKLAGARAVKHARLGSHVWGIFYTGAGEKEAESRKLRVERRKKITPGICMA